MDFRQYVGDQLPALPLDRADEIRDELAQHLDDVYREGIAEGLSHDVSWARAVSTLPDAAEELAAALRRSAHTPATRAARVVRTHLDHPPPSSGGDMFIGLRRDLRYAVRALVREPGFTAAVVLTLALGIGGTTAAYSAIDAVLVRRPPIADPDRVVEVHMVHAARATANPVAGDQVGPASYLDYLDLRDGQVLAGLAAFADTNLTFDANGAADRLPAQVVTGNFFAMLGVSPAIGRVLTPDDDQVGSLTRVAVLSHRVWQQRFGGDPGVVGRSIVLNGSPYQVVGVAPQRFDGTQIGVAPDVWVPMAMQEEVRPPSAGALRERLGGMRMLGVRDLRWLQMVGRLKDGTTLADAAAGLEVVGRRFQAAYPDAYRDLSATALTLGDGPGVRRDSRFLLQLLTATLAMMLLIACANVASLLLARAVSRRREVAVRLAIGAGRGQLVRQWLTESILLGSLGAFAGLAVAHWSVPILYGLGIPDGVELSLNVRVLAFTFATGVIAGLIFGLAPVLQITRPDTVTALRAEGGNVASGAVAARTRSAFVVVQVALSLVLLIGGGLFLRTLQQAYAVKLGYRVDHMLVVNLEPGDRYTPATGQGLYADVLNRLNALPGVVAAGAARVTVLSGATRTMPVSVDGRPIQRSPSNAIPVRANVVSDRYFNAMGVPVLAGRGFQAADLPTSPRVAIVTRSLANRLWPNANPIGQTLVSASSFTVVGVVPDTVYRTTTEREPLPIYYLPLSQNYESWVSLHIRTIGAPLSLLPAVRRVVGEVDARSVVSLPRSLEDELSRSLIEQRTMAKFVGALSVIALLLAVVGLYGVMAYTTRQRTREIGVRLALGASPASILNMVLRRGLWLVALGGSLGLACAFLVVEFVRARLFGVEPTDLLTWVAVSAVLALTGLAACLAPAKRAMRINPATTLRNS